MILSAVVYFHGSRETCMPIRGIIATPSGLKEQRKRNVRFMCLIHDAFDARCPRIWCEYDDQDFSNVDRYPSLCFRVGWRVASLRTTATRVKMRLL